MQLLGYSNKEYSIVYNIVESDMPVFDYISTMRLRPVVDGNITFFEWSVAFEIDPGKDWKKKKKGLLEQMIQSAKRAGAPQETLEAMASAMGQRTFSKLVAALGDAVPPTLFIRGLNPLELLDHALCEGSAKKSDKDLLAVATSIRIVLTEMAERIDQILRDREELNQAIDVLTANLDEEA